MSNFEQNSAIEILTFVEEKDFIMPEVLELDEQQRKEFLISSYPTDTESGLYMVNSYEINFKTVDPSPVKKTRRLKLISDLDINSKQITDRLGIQCNEYGIAMTEEGKEINKEKLWRWNEIIALLKNQTPRNGKTMTVFEPLNTDGKKNVFYALNKDNQIQCVYCYWNSELSEWWIGCYPFSFGLKKADTSEMYIFSKE